MPTNISDNIGLSEIDSIDFNLDLKKLALPLVPYANNEIIINCLSEFINGSNFQKSKDYHPLRKILENYSLTDVPLMPKRELAILGTLLAFVTEIDANVSEHYKKILARDSSGYKNYLFELEIGCFIKAKFPSMKFNDINPGISVPDFMIPGKSMINFWIEVTTTKEGWFHKEFWMDSPHDGSKYDALLLKYLNSNINKVEEHIKINDQAKKDDIQILVFKPDEGFPFTLEIDSPMTRVLTEISEERNEKFIFIVFLTNRFRIYFPENVDELNRKFIANLFDFNGNPTE